MARFSGLLVVFCLCFLPFTANAADDGSRRDHHQIKHVLLISVDGMHALDLTNYVASHPNSTLAQLSAHGTTYTNASTSQPSDSFPGLAALVTGGSPIMTGLWYDVTWNRKLSPPAASNPVIGINGGACPGTIGTIVELDEGVDVDLTAWMAAVASIRTSCHAIRTTIVSRFSRINTSGSTLFLR